MDGNPDKLGPAALDLAGMYAGSDLKIEVSRLLGDEELARRLGRAGQEHVKERFLLPRFIADKLRLLTDVVRGGR